MSNGARYERRYRRRFDEHDGVTAVRMPSSGAGSAADLPDLHVWVRGDDGVDEYAIEVKALTDTNRLGNGEIEALRRFGRATGADPRILAHVKHDGGYVLTIDELHATERGYTLNKTRDFDGARTVDEFLGRLTG